MQQPVQTVFTKFLADAS